MKNTKSHPSFRFAVVLIALGALAVLLLHQKVARIPETPSVQTNTLPSTGDRTSSPRSNATSHTNELGQVVGNDTNVSGPSVGNKAKQMAELLSTYNNVPIEFYGRVEDQFSNVVENATINFCIQVYSGTESGVERGRVITDANGQFSIKGYRGESLGLVPIKAGYALATTITLFRYSHLDDQHYVSSQQNPTVIRMWKLQGAEPLVSVKGRYRLPYTNAPMSFDLLRGQIVEAGGDLKITVNRPQGIISGQNRMDWGVQIEAIAGGLIDAAGQEGITYAAPESGYQPISTLSASTNGHGAELIQEGYFVQSRDGQVYSKIDISVRINRDPDGLMSIDFSGVANTNASRNWEGSVAQ